MKLIVAAAVVVPTLVFPVMVSAQDSGLPRSTPEAQGVSSAVVREFIEAADREVDSMHSFMLVRHGHVVAEAWWDPESADKQHVLWSLSKSFTSTAVGFAVSEGKLSIDDPVLQYLTPRLFEPLGIESPRWDNSPQGISIGGYGLFIRTEDIAKFGQLYLQKGQWNGRQILPAEWVDLATSRQVSNGSNPHSDWDQGYGFQFWRCRHDAYRGDGKDGQFCIVLPEQDAVIAITANTGNMQAELNVVWDHLLSAFSEARLDENPEEQARLQAVIAKLKASR
jgi:CubicO group peptidase (beta-lactamase class C family)